MDKKNKMSLWSSIKKTYSKADAKVGGVLYYFVFKNFLF